MSINNKTAQADEKEKPFRMTPPLHTLLCGSEEMPFGLYHFHLMRAYQECRLHHPDGYPTMEKGGSLKHVIRQMKALEKAGFVHHDTIATKAMNCPYHYFLSANGARYVALAGLDPSVYRRPDRKFNKFHIYVNHTLDINDIIIAGAILKRAYPVVWLESFVHELQTKHQPYKVDWKGKEHELSADGILDFVILLNSVERRYKVFLEHEASKKKEEDFREKVRCYIQLLHTDEFRNSNVRVAYTTTLGDNYLLTMRNRAYKELQDSMEPLEIGQRFHFTALDKWTVEQPLDPTNLWLRKHWYYPYDMPAVSVLGNQ